MPLKVKVSELVQQIIDRKIELENDINTILTKWKAKDLNELSAGIQNTIDKRNELEKEIKDKDNIISNRDKTINSLQLKNEKLSDNYKKAIQYLADARQLVSHLQKDLQTEKQDKVHIQKELNDALTILNKPKTEIGTQTDLTAEQITQMEQSITKHQSDIQQEQNNVSLLETQISNLEGKIKTLQEQVKDKETNEAEKELLLYVEKGVETPLAGTIPPNELLEKLQNENKWTSLHPEYEIVRQKLITLTKRELERRDLATKITKLEKEQGELQTKYDMEVKTKEELLEYLAIYREMNVISFSSYPNTFAGNRLFSNLDDDHKIKVEKMENFKKFMEQHGKINAVVYLYLTDNRLMELGNKHYFSSVRVWTSNAGKNYPNQNKKGQVWFKNSNRNWNISDWKNDEKIIGVDYRTNIINFSNPFISTSNGSSGFEFKW